MQTRPRKKKDFLLFRCWVCWVKRCKPLHYIQRLWVSLLRPHHKPGYLSLRRCFLLNALLLAAANYLASTMEDLRNYKWEYLIKKCMYWIPSITSRPRCLIITEKVEFNIASEVNYIYILSGQKLNKKAKKELLKKN